MTERQIQLAILELIRSAVCCAAPNYTPDGWWECDLWTVSKSGYSTEYEIKLTAQDFRADARKHQERWSYENGVIGARISTTKYEAISKSEHRPNRFYYVVPRTLACELEGEIPVWAGLMVVGEHLHSDRLRVRPRKKAPQLGTQKVTTREIHLCQRRMWYRYWESLRTIERMRDDRQRMDALRTAPAKESR